MSHVFLGSHMICAIDNFTETILVFLEPQCAHTFAVPGSDIERCGEAAEVSDTEDGNSYCRKHFRANESLKKLEALPLEEARKNLICLDEDAEIFAEPLLEPEAVTKWREGR